MKINDLLNKNDLKEDKKYYILSNILNISIPELKLNKEKELTLKQYLVYKKALRTVTKGIPLQYALKKSFFYDDYYYVNKNVLIPRFETELLVEEAQSLINKYFNKPTILDIGTGSGIIAITMKKLNQGSDVIATDISSKALKVAKKNAKEKNTNINFVKTNLAQDVNEKIDVLISNPPYLSIDATHVEEQVRKYEPHLALFADNNGTYFYEEILKDSKRIMKKRNIMLFEIGFNQKDILTKIVKKYYPKSTIIVKKDNNNFDRMLIIYNNIE